MANLGLSVSTRVVAILLLPPPRKGHFLQFLRMQSYAYNAMLSNVIKSKPSVLDSES
jgi:hypothetical protein